MVRPAAPRTARSAARSEGEARWRGGVALGGLEPSTEYSEPRAAHQPRAHGMGAHAACAPPATQLAGAYSPSAGRLRSKTART